MQEQLNLRVICLASGYRHKVRWSERGSLWLPSKSRSSSATRAMPKGHSVSISARYNFHAPKYRRGWNTVRPYYPIDDGLAATRHWYMHRNYTISPNIWPGRVRLIETLDGNFCFYVPTFFNHTQNESRKRPFSLDQFFWIERMALFQNIRASTIFIKKLLFLKNCRTMRFYTEHKSFVKDVCIQVQKENFRKYLIQYWTVSRDYSEFCSMGKECERGMTEIFQAS